MGRCNYCNYQSIKRRAKQEGSRIYKRAASWGLGGVNIYVVPKGDKLDTREDKEGNTISGQFGAWFMELPDSCHC